MNDKQQLQVMGEHQAEQHMCMAKQIEDLQARLQECAKGAAKMQEQRDALAKQVLDLTESIANNLTAKLGRGGIEVTETVRTAPSRIWLQVGDQSHYHSEPFPSDAGEVTWCADSVVGCEVPYVRVDLAYESTGQFKRLESANNQIAAMIDLLIELREGAELHLHNCTVCKNDLGISNWTNKLDRIDAVLAASPKLEPTK